jgi:hypothetical protein
MSCRRGEKLEVVLGRAGGEHLDMACISEARSIERLQRSKPDHKQAQ